MARVNANAWVPEEYGSEVLQTVNANSAVEALARKVQMTSDVHKTPRLGGLTVEVIQKGEVYPEDQPTMDNVLLEAVKFGDRVIIAEEDLDDARVDVVTALQNEWAVAYSRKLDNACLGTTAAANGDTVPFNSVYREVSQGAAGNLIQTAGAVTYADLSGVLGAAEGAAYYSDSDTVVIAHTKFKGLFRGLTDLNGRPLFVEGLAGTPGTLFGFPVQFTQGAATSATNVQNPAGNPLLIVGNRNHLILGVRSGPESLLSYDAGFGTDEPHIKMRARRAFAVGRASAFGVLEITA